MKLNKNKSNDTINEILNSLLYWKYYFCQYEADSITANYYPTVSELHLLTGTKQ